jgi:hypothetical protein
MSKIAHNAANGQHDDTSVWDVRSVRALLHAQTWKLDKDPWNERDQRLWLDRLTRHQHKRHTLAEGCEDQLRSISAK